MRKEDGEVEARRLAGLRSRMLSCKQTFFSIWPVTQWNVLSKINLWFRMQVTTMAFVM